MILKNFFKSLKKRVSNLWYQRQCWGKENWREVVQRYKLSVIKEISTRDVTPNMMTTVTMQVKKEDPKSFHHEVKSFFFFPFPFYYIYSMMDTYSLIAVIISQYM